MVEHRPPQVGPTLNPYFRLAIVGGLLVLVISCAVFVIKPNWAFKAQLGAGYGLLILLLAIFIQPDSLHRLLLGRPPRHNTTALILTIALFWILVLLNYLGLKSNYEVDLTENGRFTLSAPTVEFLENLKEPVQVLGFFHTGDYRWAVAENSLERYNRFTDQLTYAFYDPTIEPALAQSYELKSYGLVFVSGMHHAKTSIIDEQSITKGMMCVTSSDHNSECKTNLSIMAKTPTKHHVYLSSLQTGFILVIALIAIPMTMLGMGIKVWWMRR